LEVEGMTLTAKVERRARLLGSAGAGALVLLLVLATGVFAAAGDPVYDWSSSITVTGFIAGVAAAITAVFVTAIGIRLMFKAARLTLKALNFIK
jgi:type IV secretory pathway VirB2 component (pilin)